MDEYTFLDEIHHSPINLPKAALCFAREIAYPDLDVQDYLARFDQLAVAAQTVVPPESPVFTRAAALARYLFQDLGFQGNEANYHDPRNSFLNEVLERHLGIPISLAVLYTTIAQQLGLPAQGVGLPGHFIIGITAPDTNHMYLDPFHGGAPLSVQDCALLVQLTAGYQEPFHNEWLNPVSAVDILTRMLNNLKNIYLHQEDWPHALAVLEHLQALHPELPDFLRDLGTLHHKNGSLQRAILYYDQYLLRAPDATDQALVRRNQQALVEKLARLN